MVAIFRAFFGAVSLCFILYCVRATNNTCPGLDLAFTIAEQNELLVTIVKDQQTMIIHLSQLEAALQKRFAELKAQLELTKEELQPTKAELQSIEAELQSTRDDAERHKNELKDIKKKLQDAYDNLRKRKRAGSTYVRWGKKDCRQKESSSKLVYTGMVGGKLFTDKGSGTNSLCLPLTPQYDNETKRRYNGRLYGSEYEDFPGLQNKEIPCSVCRTLNPCTVMIPGTNQCPEGWTPQYSGRLMSGYYNHYATEFVCLDKEAEELPSDDTNSNGLLFYLVLSRCGSLPCPPYGEGKVATCVVCSK